MIMNAMDVEKRSWWRPPYPEWSQKDKGVGGDDLSAAGLSRFWRSARRKKKSEAQIRSTEKALIPSKRSQENIQRNMPSWKGGDPEGRGMSEAGRRGETRQSEKPSISKGQKKSSIRKKILLTKDIKIGIRKTARAGSASAFCKREGCQTALGEKGGALGEAQGGTGGIGSLSN